MKQNFRIDFRFNTYAAARSFVDRCDAAMMIVLGDNDLLWVMTPAAAQRAANAGYEIVS